MPTSRQIADADVINSATPLEQMYAGTHPRLYLKEADFKRLTDPAQSDLVRRTVNSLLQDATQQLTDVCPQAMGIDEDPRRFGTALPCLALAWRLTGEDRYLHTAIRHMQAMNQWDDWGNDLIFGHFAHGYAVAMDWLWHDIDSATRNVMVDCLARNTNVLFEDWRSYKSGPPFAYTWNHHTVPLSGLTAAACALYGERPNISPWLNMATEKVRCITAALGPDGVSPESMAYGAYFAHYLMRCLLLLRDLGGIDLLSGVAWWREYSRALIHHTLPRRHWSRSSAFMMFGDTDGRHWYGPDPVCHICAAVFQDGHAQWLADAVVADGASETAGERIISLGMLDATVQPEPPDALPTFVHFADQGLAIGRSGWHGNETVWGIRSGPPMAYSGHRAHRNPIAGGHMHAFAGTFQIFAHGQYIIAPAGYTQKWTTYHNTLMVNGRGQLGESAAWYEDLPFRQGRPMPSMTVLHDSPQHQHVLADMTPAYPDELHLTKVHRHFICPAPDCWIIIDIIDAAQPVKVEALFHTGFSLEPATDGTYSGGGRTASTIIRPLWPTDTIGTRSQQELLHTNGTIEKELNGLTLTAPDPTAHLVLVTMVRAGEAGQHLDPGASTDVSAGRIIVELPADLDCPPIDIAYAEQPVLAST